jgi:hypothetical protein
MVNVHRCGLLALVVLTIAAYVTSYYDIVWRIHFGRAPCVGDRIIQWTPVYRHHYGANWEHFYRPIHWVDRNVIRPAHWILFDPNAPESRRVDESTKEQPSLQGLGSENLNDQEVLWEPVTPLYLD